VIELLCLTTQEFSKELLVNIESQFNIFSIKHLLKYSPAAHELVSCSIQSIFVNYLNECKDSNKKMQILKMFGELVPAISECLFSTDSFLIEESFDSTSYNIISAAKDSLSDVLSLYKGKVPKELWGNTIQTIFGLEKKLMETGYNQGGDHKSIEQQDVLLLCGAMAFFPIFVRNENSLDTFPLIKSAILSLSRSFGQVREGNEHSLIYKLNFFSCISQVIKEIPQAISQLNLCGSLFELCFAELQKNYEISLKIYITEALSALFDQITTNKIIFHITDEQYVFQMGVLLKNTENEHAQSMQLQQKLFEVIISLVLTKPITNFSIAANLLEYLMNRICNSLNKLQKNQSANNTSFDSSQNQSPSLENENKETLHKSQTRDISGSPELCLGAVQALLMKDLEKALFKFVPQISDILAGILASDRREMFEETFNSIGVIFHYSKCAPEVSLKMAESFYLHIIASIRNSEEPQNCKAAINCLADLAHALGKKASVIADEAVSALFSCVQKNNVDGSIKPAAIECFADLAMALEEQFEKYTHNVKRILVEASFINSFNSNISESFFENLCRAVTETAEAILITNPSDIDFSEKICENYLGVKELNSNSLKFVLSFAKTYFESKAFLKDAFERKNLEKKIAGLFERSNKRIGNRKKIEEMVYEVNNILSGYGIHRH